MFFQKRLRLALIWTSILFVVTLCWMTFEKLMGWHDEAIAEHAVMTNLYDACFVLIFALAFLHYRKLLGSLSFQQGFMFGLMITIMIALLSPLTQTIIHEVISPSYFQNIIEYAVSNNYLTREAAEGNFNLSSYILQNFIGTLILGSIVSAIMALLMRKKLPAE